MPVAVFNSVHNMPATFCTVHHESVHKESVRPPGQFDLWSSIQSQINKEEESPIQKQEPYIHPSLKHSSSHLSQKSLEMCTESLCSETGSDDFFESDFFSSSSVQSLISKTKKNNETQCLLMTRKEYNSTVSPPRRSFPPPLPSLSRRDGLCMQMRTHRTDGRLVVQAVTVPAQNYLHAERQNGRLLLSFMNTATTTISYSSQLQDKECEMLNQTEEEEHEYDQDVKETEQEQDEEEEEVEVVDRGTIVEVKVSTQPQTNSGISSMKVHRSSIVINKFVSCIPTSKNSSGENYKTTDYGAASQSSPPKRVSVTITTAAAAAVAASSVSAMSDGEGAGYSGSDNKLLFTSKRKNREELLHDMRCSELRKPLFIWEPCCIATST